MIASQNKIKALHTINRDRRKFPRCWGRNLCTNQLYHPIGGSACKHQWVHWIVAFLPSLHSFRQPKGAFERFKDIRYVRDTTTRGLTSQVNKRRLKKRRLPRLRLQYFLGALSISVLCSFYWVINCIHIPNTHKPKPSTFLNPNICL